MIAGWLVDPVTREPLPALVAADDRLRPLSGERQWLGEHDKHAPGWEISEPDDLGIVWMRQCQRPCVHLLAPL